MEMEKLLLYIGLEDGTFFMMMDATTAAYREPGNSGFIMNNTILDSDDPNYKHFISCVNSTNGEQSNCILDNNAQYIECVNECELISCANVESMNATSLCRNYIISPKDDTITRGYIPSTFYCVNQQAQPEQLPGSILKDPITNQLGNCYYRDDVTLVNCTLAGDYLPKLYLSNFLIRLKF